jgi:hypothetical protein
VSIAIKPIHDPVDERIACYHRKHYDFRNLKARSMAWFIQVAIRRDMNKCINGRLDYDDAMVQFQGHREIFDKIDDLEAIIRQHHIVDEADLGTIGLTLYNFPTLSHFFVSPRKQAFVREVTIRELLDKTDYLKNLVLNSRLSAYVPEHDHEEIGGRATIAFVNQMTPSTLEKEAGFEQEAIRKEKFLLVDMAAPVTVLKQQFLKLLDRESRLKQGEYDDWEEYGILPYLDMRRWIARNHRKVTAKTRVELIYPNRLHGYGPKKIEETTVPHIEKLMDEKGPVFRGLLADASDEFRDALAWTRQEDPDANPSTAEEVLKRWLPRTYPFNFPDLDRTARMIPDLGERLQKVAEHLRNETQDRSLMERIRIMGQTGDGTALLRAMEKLRGKDACAYPITDSEEADFHIGDSFKGPADFDFSADVELWDADHAPAFQEQ